MNSLPIKIISAGAGSGKTYRLAEELVQLLQGDVRPSGIIATTFTNKAAAELQERVRIKLLEKGLTDKANELTNALIGSVHSLGVKLLRRFAFEAGVSPEVSIIADEDQQVIFNNALSMVLQPSLIRTMEEVSRRLGLSSRDDSYDFRVDIKRITDIARTNDLSIEVLEESKVKSLESFFRFFAPISDQEEDAFDQAFQKQIEETIQRLAQSDDETKTTRVFKEDLQKLLNKIRIQPKVEWHEWIRAGKAKVAKASKESVQDFVQFVQTHQSHPRFRRDIQTFIEGVFDGAIAALKEYADYKTNRGLIDYIDMEILVKNLLDHPRVQTVLKQELDLLMVDEFQDTSPIQLELFLKLSQMTRHSIWVGDPKQSIYGFRGAAPELMQAVIEQTGGIKPENVQRHSWRSREELVYGSNALFTRAFSNIPSDQVSLDPKRRAKASSETANSIDEPAAISGAFHHWHFEPDEGKKRTSRAWFFDSVARRLAQMLEDPLLVFPKGETQWRPAQGGDVAILCRSNYNCQKIAEALHKMGLKASLSRAGLMQTTEVKLVLACLKYLLQKEDTLSVAELLLLSGEMPLEEIITNRMDYLQTIESSERPPEWASDKGIIQQLAKLREEVVELSSNELLNLVVEQLDLTRLITNWGSVEQRLSNLDMLRRYSLQYEEACNRMHTAASLGGFLLYLNELEAKSQDMQGSGQSADAIEVLTYHRSKGLEWPIVIMMDLENMLRDDVLGIQLVSERAEVDMNDILGGRWLRFWINPYGKQIGGTSLKEQLSQTPEQAATTQQSLAEEARLLYVGVTRARDYLVIPTRKGADTGWLNRVWNQGESAHPTWEHYTDETPWIWQGTEIQKETDVIVMPPNVPGTPSIPEALHRLHERIGANTFYPPAQFDPEKEHTDDIEFKLRGPIVYGVPLLTKGDPLQYTKAKALKALTIADQLHYTNTERLELASTLLNRYEGGLDLDPNQVLQMSTTFQEWIRDQWDIKAEWRKFPLHLSVKDRTYSKIADFVLQTDQGLILIQNSGFFGQEKGQKKKVIELAGWFHYSQEALKQQMGQPVLFVGLHFVSLGTIWEVETMKRVLF